jgi:hypothetical protein
VNYYRQREWSDVFIPQIKAILGQQLIQTAPFHEDTKRNTDLIMVSSGCVRIACRVRKHDGLAKGYGNQITIRTQTRHKKESEFDKILAGWGDLMFYAFENEAGDGFAQWVIVSLDYFRQHWRMAPSIDVINTDGTAGEAYPLDQGPLEKDGFILYHSGQEAVTT